jgi:glycosyltransferase involved in cell wall biosynthesis
VRLLFINYEYPPVGAGAATATADMARSAVRHGHHVTVLTAAYGGNAGWAEESGILLRRVASRRRRADRSSVGEMASFVARAALALPWVARRSRAQACIVFFSLPCGPLGLLFRALTGGPYVVSLRGGDVPGTEPQLARMHRWLRPLRRLALSRAAAVVANSPGLAKLSQDADPVAVAMIPNGVDLERFQPGPAPPAEPFHFLFVGRLNAQKNVDLLLAATAELRRGAPPPFRLSIVGDGPLAPALHERADALGLQDLITWERWLPRERMPAVYRSAHCLVNPSHYEGMPNVVLEAMACGVPAIVSDVAGNRDVVESGANGIVVAHDSRGELVDAMSRVLRERERLAALGRRARALARERHSWDAATLRFIELLSPGAKTG